MTRSELLCNDGLAMSREFDRSPEVTKITTITKVTTADLLTVPQVSKTLGVHHATIYRWIDAGKILGIKIGGILFIQRSEVERLKNKQGAGEAAP